MNLTSIGKALAGMFKKSGILAPVDNRGGGWWPIVREPFGGAWQQNIEWSVDSVVANPTVYSCITLISNDIGKLRPTLVQKDIDGIWTEFESPSFSPVLRKPNRYQNRIQFLQYWIMSKLTRGNTYALKERDSRGVVVGLYILDPMRVQVLVADDGAVYYQLNQDNLTGVKQQGITVPASEIIHDRMNCIFHPLVGISPLFAAGIAANIGLKIQTNSELFFTNGSNPSGILTAPGSISNESAQELKDHWNTNFTGANSGKVAVLGDGLKFEAMRMTAVDSQLIQILNWSDERICSVFHVPTYKVGVGAAPSYNNIESLSQEYYGTCLQILIEELEAVLDDGLGLDGFRRGVELDLDGLLRMDSKTKMETISAGITSKALTINDARLSLNKKPLDGGDTVYMQMQDLPLSEIKNNKIAEKVEPTVSAPVVEPVDTTDEVNPEEQMRSFIDRISKGLADA